MENLLMLPIILYFFVLLPMNHRCWPKHIEPKILFKPWEGQIMWMSFEDIILIIHFHRKRQTFHKKMMQMKTKGKPQAGIYL